MSFCLPKFAAEALIKRLPEDLSKLTDATSEERRKFFSDVVGEENAKKVNALFESKLLLKDQQRGIINWVKKVTGITPETQRDIISRVNKMSEVLQPKDQEKFLEDLAAHKLGMGVTVEEAGKIAESAKEVSGKKEVMNQDVNNVPNRIAYGRSLMDFNDLVESMKPSGNSFYNTILNLANLPKSALTSVFHMSAPFVQGWGMVGTGNFWKAFGNQFKYFASAESFKNLNAYIISHPDYSLAVDGKLGITKLGDKLNSREEAIQSSLLEKIPVVNKAVVASSRAFTGFLNEVRFTRFTDLLDAARTAGEDVQKGSPVVHDIAKVVNDFTGRGAIGKGDKYANLQSLLNATFFSPRKISATMEMFDPVRYLDPRISPTARLAALRQLTGSVLATGAVLTLASAMGGKVNLNPDSTDFAKIQIGNSKLDVTGGNAIYLRLLARIITGKQISSAGKTTVLGQGYKPLTRADLLLSYARGKLSPIASTIADALYGKDPVGAPFSVGSEIYNKLTPIVMQNFINLGMKDPKNTAIIIPALSSLFGVGLEAPTTKK